MSNVSTLDLGALLRKNNDELLGFVLDFARVSQMGDRQFSQFEKSVKRHFRDDTDALLMVLRSYIEEKKILIVTDRLQQGS